MYYYTKRALQREAVMAAREYRKKNGRAKVTSWSIGIPGKGDAGTCLHLEVTLETSPGYYHVTTVAI